MKRTFTLISVFALMLGVLAMPATAETEPLEQHCPGAVDEASPNYVAVPDGLEIVLSNDDTSPAGAASNDIVLPAGTLVCIKGGPLSTGILTADGTSTLKELLGQYVTVGQGNVPDVSYYMTYRRIPTDPGNWCSPGFWKNSPIQAAHAAALVTEWPQGASLANYQEILDNPQQYASSGLYEAVADALSKAHPGVNFLGERVEDSCPLRADAAEFQTKAPVFGKKK